VHRDIKLENLLMDSDRNMKIIDFGLAAIFTEGSALKVHCGSPSYAAPEIIGRRSYSGPPVDVWSLGIVTFAMVCGHLPFYSRNGEFIQLLSSAMFMLFSCVLVCIGHRL
jgi:5'-AMP-activated protein kinase, catalytic alpha subunit